MTTRQDQLPGGPSGLGRQLADLERQLRELRAVRPDLSAADALLPPLDADPTRWPQTTLSSWTTIAACSNVRWSTQLRLVLITATSGGGAGNIRVTVNGAQWGPVVAAGTPYDYTGDLPSTIAVGAVYRLTVDAQRTSGSGTVHAQTQLIRNLM
ncbi:hypothetical protein [Kitasatospora sp. A2-31]|uniref:hypothetical protein n=1 Tax=Kitasatospora sp. A2-31 TaxID=2916414 RepID=UPI001EEE56FF|nr:hypothetical protein [Kitasatospora sp. A2-31]MCG6499471.1 hypothetical protein [Kitasatospora sp. A2-31]